MSFRDEVIWLAGLLEGEGCFSAGRQRREFVIKLKMTDRDVIARAHRLCKGRGRLRETLGAKAGYKPVFSFEINGHLAASWAMMVYAFMGRRRQAKIRQLLAWWRQRVAVYGKPRRERCRRGHMAYRLSRGGHRYCPDCVRLNHLKRPLMKLAARRAAPSADQLSLINFRV